MTKISRWLFVGLFLGLAGLALADLPPAPETGIDPYHADFSAPSFFVDRYVPATCYFYWYDDAADDDAVDDNTVDDDVVDDDSVDDDTVDDDTIDDDTMDDDTIDNYIPELPPMDEDEDGPVGGCCGG